MRKRTYARECALKILYRVDIAGDRPEDFLEEFWQAEDMADSSVREFSTKIILGVCEHRKVIDELIKAHTTNWQLERMAVIDRNVLRLSIFELVFLKDIPPKVSINEAVELAKRYGDKDSGRFVNGILDKVRKEKEDTGI